MRLKLFLVLLLLITSFSLSQEIKTLTIDEAVTQAVNNNVQLKYQGYEIQKADGFLSNAGIIPNPEAAYYREDLSDNNLDYNEWTVSGSMPLNFLWNRWSAVSSASSHYESAKLNYELVKFNLSSDVKYAFVKVHFHNEISNAWLKALNVIEQVKQTANAREDEGEISGYDNQRILLEYFLYKKNYSEAKTSYQKSLNELLLLINPLDSLESIRTIFNYSSNNIPEPADSLIQEARRNRLDIKAASLNLEGKSSALTNEQLKIIPDVSFNLGYKEQADNLKGFVYGFKINIPLFGRNQGNIEIAEAELNQQKVLNQFLIRKIETDVRIAYRKLKEYEDQLNTLKQFQIFDPEDIINTAEFSYEEGEMSLIELIDAIRSYTDSFLLTNELLLNYYQSLFELEKAIGKEL